MSIHISLCKGEGCTHLFDATLVNDGDRGAIVIEGKDPDTPDKAINDYLKRMVGVRTMDGTVLRKVW